MTPAEERLRAAHVSRTVRSVTISNDPQLRRGDHIATRCKRCGTGWPCDTIVALDAASAREDALVAALRATWRWSVRTGPFITTVISLAEDKGAGLNLLSDVPALRQQVLDALGLDEAALAAAMEPK